ncbi:hotdog fold thioesterase (plasmid) [Rhodococcus opacus]|uniref:PaaI family thioesterase n=1 Tax=Rhodococcus opacus TaxID=37919 RepID=UPI0034D2D7E7
MTIDDQPTLRFFSTNVEALFRVADVTGDATHGVTEMTTGAWLSDERGRACRGSLGVVMDDVMGHLVSSATPEGQWSVSTEIHLDFIDNPPTDGSVLHAESTLITRGANGGLAGGRVVDSDGRLIVSGSTRLQNVAIAQEPRAVRRTPDALRDRREARSIGELLGAVQRREDGATRLELGPSEFIANPLGNIHGGVLLCASEMTGMSALPAAADFHTTSIHIAYLRPCPADEQVTFVPKVLHHGRSLGVVQVMGLNRVGKICTTATVTSHSP